MPKPKIWKPYIFAGPTPPDPFNPGERWTLPPHRPQPIPFCGTSVGGSSFKGSSSVSRGRGRGRGRGKNPPNFEAVSKPAEPEGSRGKGSSPPEVNNGKAASVKSVEYTNPSPFSLSISEAFSSRPRLNFALAGAPKTNHKVQATTVGLVTEIGGWEETQPVEPITIMRLIPMKRNPNHPRYALKRKGIYLVRLHHITDPSNFFMELIVEPPKDGCATWEESLNKFYSDPVTAQNYKMRTIQPVIGQQYAYYNEELKKWERVRVHEAYYDEQLVAVVYMDRLSYDYVPIESLFELHPRFGNWHRYPINGGLRDVVPWHDSSVPLTVDEAGSNPWAPEAINFFKEYTKDKIFQALVVTREFDMQDNLKHVSDETRFAKLTVVLFEEGAKYDIPVNVMLIQKGYATPIRGMTDWKHMIKCFSGLEIADENIKPNQGSSFLKEIKQTN